MPTGTLADIIRRWLRKKGVHWDEWEQEKKPMLELRKKQGGGMWQADIGIDEETEEERKKKKK